MQYGVADIDVSQSVKSSDLSSLLTPKLGTKERINMLKVKTSTITASYAQLQRRRNTNKINHIQKLVRRQVTRKAKAHDKCHGHCNHKEHQLNKQPPAEILTPYERIMVNLATPDFSLHSKSVKQIIKEKQFILDSDETTQQKKQRIYNKVIDVVNNEIDDKMAKRNTSALHAINKYKLMATSMSSDKGVTL